MRKKISISTVITLLVLTAALTISITMLVAIRYFNKQVESVSQRQAMYTHINDLDKKVRDYYKSLDEKALQQGITAGYVEGLQDKYAAYYSPSAYVKEELRLSGKANNMGVEMCYDLAGALIVSKVHPDSPAAKAGVQKGDVVVAVDSEKAAEVSIDVLQKKLDTAEKAMLSVTRNGTETAFNLSAFQYTVRTVTATLLDDVAYVKIDAFLKNTPDQFRSVVSSMEEKGAAGYIFDLRGNRGGDPAAIQEILSYIVPLGVYGSVVDTAGAITNLTSTDSHQISAPSVTLVDGATAGEAELFAGALQEGSLTTVIGETTAGKAKYQNYFTLESDRSAIKLTVGEYTLLKSGSWQGKGITPTMELPLPENQAKVHPLVEPKDDIQVQAGLAQISSASALNN